MTPAQRGAQTRTWNAVIRDAVLTAARLPERRGRVAETQRLVHELAETVASTAPLTLTTLGPEGVPVNELTYVIGVLNQEVHWLKEDEDLVNQMRLRYPDELATAANVIAFRPRTEG